MQSNVSGHWTDEQLILQMYGAVSTADAQHLDDCLVCRSRLETMEASRAAAAAHSADEDISPAFLQEQRRRIYERLERPQSRWQTMALWRWASAGTAAAALAGGLVMFTAQHPGARVESKVSDAELAQEVSCLSLDAEAKPAAPLKALFE